VITVTVRKSGILRRAWRMKIQGGNNERLPHDYNDKDGAVKTATLMFGSDEPVILRIVEENGLVHTTKLR
jgi:hypothetical protein